MPSDEGSERLQEDAEAAAELTDQTGDARKVGRS
jgi:hypothetical protein